MKNNIYGWILLLLIGIATAAMLTALASPEVAMDSAAHWYYAVLAVLGMFFMIVVFHFSLEPKAKTAKRKR